MIEHMTDSESGQGNVNVPVAALDEIGVSANYPGVVPRRKSIRKRLRKRIHLCLKKINVYSGSYIIHLICILLLSLIYIETYIRKNSFDWENLYPMIFPSGILLFFILISEIIVKFVSKKNELLARHHAEVCCFLEMIYILSLNDSIFENFIILKNLIENKDST